MRELVVLGSDKRLASRENNLLVKNMNGTIEQILTLDRIESISIYGNSQVSTQLIKAIGKRQIHLHYFSKMGTYLSSLMSAKQFNYEDQIDQFLASGRGDFSLNLAKRIVRSKVVNQQLLLKSYDEDGLFLDEDLVKFEKYIQSIQQAESIDSLRGYEGKAATLYFFYLKWILPVEWGFKKRTKHPPKDPFSSLISLGYSLLYSYMVGQIYKYGLNPGIGIMHQNKRKHATLSSDLMEEWRAVIVDDTAVKLVTTNKIKPTDFFEQNGKICLNNDKIQMYLNQLNDRLYEGHDYFSVGKQYSARYAINLQLESLKRAFATNNSQEYMVLKLGDQNG